MKEYLKMADVFEFSETTNPDFHMFIKRGHIDTEEAEYAAHAINSHDELVAEVAKLTDLCERFSTFCEDVGEFMGSGRSANSVRNEYMEHKSSKAP